MKLHGHTTLGSTSEFVLASVADPDAPEGTTDLVVTLKPFGLGFRRTLAKRIPDPRAPVKVLRDAAGKPQRYEGVGPNVDGKPIVAPDESDPDYRSAVTEANELQLIASFYEATKGDERLVFEATEPGEGASVDEWRAFYTRIREEIDASGLPMGKIVQATVELGRLSGINAEAIHALADRFSGGAT